MLSQNGVLIKHVIVLLDTLYLENKFKHVIVLLDTLYLDTLNLETLNLEKSTNM